MDGYYLLTAGTAFLFVEHLFLPLGILAMWRVWRQIKTPRLRDEVAAMGLLLCGMLLFDLVLAYARFLSSEPFWSWQSSIDVARAARALPLVLMVTMAAPCFTDCRRRWALRGMVAAIIAAMGAVVWLAPS